METKGRKITVVGLARSGVGAANLLAGLGADVTVTDRKPEAELSDYAGRLLPGVKRALGGHPEEIFLSADILVVSPGVPLEMKQIASARAAGVPVVGELELAFQILESAKLMAHGKSGGKMPFLAVTGSNGKSTTTTLLDFMLKKGGFRTILAGNIGNALTEELVKRQKLNVKSENSGKSVPFTIDLLTDYIVLEVSSFQLDAIATFRPHIAAVLNITPDHLDRYHSIEEYGRSKARVFENQGSGDFLVLNADDPETMKVERELLQRRKEKPEVLYFSRKKEVRGVFWRDGSVFCDIPHLSMRPDRPFLASEEIMIKGVHNLENAMAASAMALLAGCPAGPVRESLREFGGLEHRLEFVRELDGVRYVNDSKGTNVGAVLKSVESFEEQVILIAGGRDKAGDFSELRPLISRKVKTLVLIGEAAQKIRDAVGDATDTVTAADLREAVGISRARAGKGDVVLLSPACASFDMFRDFEDRGRQFKKIVMDLGT
ncbi:MAG: UDP-N-acetylmuramoyl-L-alanine--D-glutamate ligase [Nitrospiraceae bacterium]|nr:UDP-N-acetylmuramoyl-L-alanine--D-glutamate ligase [Nitrospiraceae bacterium]